MCKFCNQAVRRLLRADKNGLLHFAPLQSATAQAVLARHPQIPADLDSIVYVRRDDSHEHVSWRADAMFEILRDLPGWWRMLAWLRWLPHALSDRAYRYFAANRYRWFGKHDACPLPSASERARFLD